MLTMFKKFTLFDDTNSVASDSTNLINMKEKPESQVQTLLKLLLSGIKIDRVMAFQKYGIADLRSRLSDVKREYNISPKRARKPGKKYLEYWIENYKTFQV